MLLLSKYLRIGKLVIVFLFLFKNNLISQNLVRNGSFENYNTPIDWNLWGGDFIGYYTWPPDTVMIDWKQYSSPDLFISACTHTYSGVPVNIIGNGYSQDGYNHVGFIAYVRGSNIKEYVQQYLSQPLQIGRTYCLSFYVSKADRIPYAIKSIGAYFSNSAPNTVSGYQINVTPQIVNASNFITDTISWTKIQGCYTANGGEQYLTIGNFNSNTDTLNVGTTNQVPNGENESYYYLDNITLIDQSTIGLQDISTELGDRSVYPNPANDVLNIDVGHIYENADIKIYDALGEVVLSEDLTTQNSSLNIHHLQSGIYFYTILVGEKNIKTDKIVIIK